MNRITMSVFAALIIFNLFITVPLFAQASKADSSSYFNPITDDITKRLPPLRVMVDSAGYNSPDLRYEDLKADYYYYEQISAAREWMEALSLNVDLNIGKWDYWDKDEITRVDRYYNSQSIRDNYAIGFYVRMPIATLVDRRNRVKKQKKWIELSLTQKEINRRFIQERVITVYNDLVSAQNQIRIYNDYQTFTMMQMAMAENEFLNGEITTAEYTRLKEIQTRGAVEYQQVIAEFNKLYQILEVITGIRFNLINVLR
ncbi:MAG: TolC family protein [Bacteroidales bacterium]